MSDQSSKLDVEAVRGDFPILSRVINGHPIVYLDSTATSQKPNQVIDALSDFYRTSNANVHRGIYTLSEESTAAYEGAREKTATFINAASTSEIIFTRNTTESLNLLAFAWGRANLNEGDEVLVTLMEHHSNIVPWHMICEERGAIVRFIPVTDEGFLDLSDIDSLINERTKVVSFTHVSNVLGTINPVRELVDRAHAVGAIAIVDGAQGAPHMAVDVREMDADFYVFSSHKMLGPTGVGVLYGKRELLDEMPPFLGGGEMIMEVREDGFTWKDPPWKFEAGTPNFADVVAFGVAIDYLTDLGMDAVRQHEIEITAYALKQMESLGEGVTVHGPTDPLERGGVVSFAVESVHPHDIAQTLDWEGVQIRAGHHCAQPLMRRLNVPATARASFYVYNTNDDVDRLVDALKKAGELFGRQRT